MALFLSIRKPVAYLSYAQVPRKTNTPNAVRPPVQLLAAPAVLGDPGVQHRLTCSAFGGQKWAKCFCCGVFVCFVVCCCEFCVFCCVWLRLCWFKFIMIVMVCVKIRLNCHWKVVYMYKYIDLRMVQVLCSYSNVQ